MLLISKWAGKKLVRRGGLGGRSAIFTCGVGEGREAPLRLRPGIWGARCGRGGHRSRHRERGPGRRGVWESTSPRSPTFLFLAPSRRSWILSTSENNCVCEPDDCLEPKVENVLYFTGHICLGYSCIAQTWRCGCRTRCSVGEGVSLNLNILCPIFACSDERQ